jgi:hypothetical protein
MWSLLCPEMSSLIRLEHWFGAKASVSLTSLLCQHEREMSKVELLDVLTNKLMGRGKVHRDVFWRKIGKYKRNSGSVVLVVFDLNDMVDYDVDAHGDWIGAAMKQLFDQ